MIMSEVLKCRHLVENHKKTISIPTITTDGANGKRILTLEGWFHADAPFYGFSLKHKFVTVDSENYKKQNMSI